MRNNLSKDYRCNKLRGGPGGWHCTCCNPFNCHPRNMKSLARRLVRRASKQALHKAIEAEKD